MPQANTPPAREVFNAALQRLYEDALRAALSAEAFSALRTTATMGAARINQSVYATVTDEDVAAARELVRKINDLLEVAPVDARDGLRRTRLDLEELIDRKSIQDEDSRRFKAKLAARWAQRAARNASGEAHEETGSADAPNTSVEG